MMQQYGHQNVITINATFGTNENKVIFFNVSLLHVSNSREYDETQC